MLTPKPASLAQLLPYWQLVRCATGDEACPQQTFLLLKDGSLVVGLHSDGVDVTGRAASQLDEMGRQLARAMAGLPARSFLQASFCTGQRYDEMLTDFAGRSRADAHPLLRRGRAEQMCTLQMDARLVRARLFYWVGFRGVLAGVVRNAASVKQQRHNQALLQEACQRLYDSARQVRATLMGQNIPLGWASAAQVLAELQEAVAPNTFELLAPAPPPSDQRGGPPTAQATTPGWDAPRLDERLARRSFRCAADHLALAHHPRAGANGQAEQLRLYGMTELPASTDASMLHGWPFEAAGAVPMRLVFCHEKLDAMLQRTELQQRRKWLYALMGRYFMDHEAKQAYEETEQVLAQMAQSEAQVMRSSVCACLGPASAQAQVTAGSQLVQAAAARGLSLALCEDMQLKSWLGSLPGYGYSFPLRYRLLDQNAAHLTPVFLPSQGDNDADLIMGTRQKGLSKLSIRLGERHDASALVVGKTGSGKTFLFSWLAKYGCLDLGGHVVIADNKGPKNSSYRPLCALLGGQYVHLEHDEQVSFNPFFAAAEVRLADGQLNTQRLESLESILFMMTEDARSTLHPDYARNVLRRLVHELYRRWPQAGPLPRLSDAVAVAKQLTLPSDTLRQTADAVAERLQLWCEDPVRRRLFDTPKTLATPSRLTVFDFHGFTRDSFLAAVLISILAQRIESKMNELPRDTPKLFAFDEAWAMFDGSVEATRLLNRLYRTARSYGACIYTLTQSHYDVTQSVAAQGILANVGMIYLMRHQDGHAATADHFGLNPAQQALFRGLQMVPGEFAESLLVEAQQGRTRVLRYQPSAFDLWCDTSRPDDVSLRDEALAAGSGDLEHTIVTLAKMCPRGAPSSAQQRRAVLHAVVSQQQERRAS